MARKKRKALAGRGLNPRPERSGREFNSRPALGGPNAVARPGWENIGLPALGALVLVLAWLAALGGFSDGTGHIQTFMNNDAVRLLIFYRELFERGAALSSLTQGGAPYYFPDMALQWGLFALGAETALTLCVYPLLIAALSAGGWMLLCDRLFGKNPVRRAVVLMLHAPPFLFLAWDNADVFHSQMMGVIHHGVVAALPWLLWLSLLVLFPAKSSGRGGKSAAFPAGSAVALVVLLALMSASDLLVVPQFVAPVGLCALILAGRKDAPWREVLIFFALLGAGVVGGRILGGLPDIDTWAVPGGLDLGNFPRLLGLLAAHFGHAAVRNPLALLVWLVFAAIAAWRALAVLSPRLRRGVPAFIAVPPGAAHSLAALFVPAAIAAAFLSPAAAGAGSDDFSYLHSNAPPYQGVMFNLRYALPVVFLPLFVGWALLPGGIPKFGARTAALSACAVLLAVAAPKAARLDAAALDPFATPFQKCFAENAARLGWRGGIMTMALARLPLVHSGAEINRLLPVGVIRHPEPGRSFMVVESSFSRRAVSGEFEFVAANLYNGRYFNAPPLAGEAGCEANNPASCHTPINNYILDADSARAAFGAPKEEINCAGIGLLHYDPPLRFDFSDRDHSYLAPVARW